MEKNNKWIILNLFLIFPFLLKSEIKSPVKLYPKGAPDDNGITKQETFDGKCIYNVTEASFSIFYPKTTNTGVSVLVCPGGGYAKEAVIHEGYQYAEWLSSQGITAFVLKYRLPNGHKNIPLEDVCNAMIFIREHAQDLGIHPNKIGISGFSAGGHLAAIGGTKLVEDNSKPNFMILFYPVITLDNTYTRAGSIHNLLGDNPSKEDIESFSADKNVTSLTPPTIIFLSDDDPKVNTMNSILFYEKLKQNNIPVSLNIYPIGKHGWGFRPYFEYHEIWKTQLLKWLQNMNIMTARE